MTLKCYTPTTPKALVSAPEWSASYAGAVTPSSAAAPPVAGAAGAQLQRGQGSSSSCCLLLWGRALEQALAHLFPVTFPHRNSPCGSPQTLLPTFVQSGTRYSSTGGGFGGQRGTHTGEPEPAGQFMAFPYMGHPTAPHYRSPVDVRSGVRGQSALGWFRSSSWRPSCKLPWRGTTRCLPVMRVS